MADPFEVRMRFTSQLQHLNASVTSAQKAAHYALKHREMDEDLHSCILEQLERNNMNNRANIMYFFEALCDKAASESHPEYIRMMERDILRIIDLVAPDDGSGAANVKVVRKVLDALRSKHYLRAQTVVELEDCIKDRDTEDGGATVEAAAAETRSGRLDKRQIEQRIEEDRERHKRLRESIWAVPAGEDEEFRLLWDEVDGVFEDDFVLAKEACLERRKGAEVHRLEILGL